MVSVVPLQAACACSPGKPLAHVRTSPTASFLTRIYARPSLSASPSQQQQQQQQQAYLFILCASTALPEIDLSRTLAKTLLSTRLYRKTLYVLGRYFQWLVWLFRVGLLCFGGLLGVDRGALQHAFVSVQLPSMQSLFATTLFVSLDVLQLLCRSYEFWCMTVINSLNWITLAFVLGDTRALMSFLGWYAFQIVIAVDASYRTVITAVNSMVMAVPIMVILCCVVALQSIPRGFFFAVNLNGDRLYDAADIMGFTTSTLAILLAKMVVLKKRHVEPPIAGQGFLKVPCVLIRTNLRLVPVAHHTCGNDTVRAESRRGSTIHVRTASTTQSVCSVKTSTQRPLYVQRLQLSPLAIPHIDGRRTLLAYRHWSQSSSWIFRHQRKLRRVLFSLGVAGFGLLCFQTVRVFSIQIRATRQQRNGNCDPNSISTSTSTSTSTSSGSSVVSPTPADRASALASLVCSVLFTATCTCFFQRDLMRILLVNFDYVFSNIQVVLFCGCILDLVCWQTEYTVVIITWLVWFQWALSIDALSPLATQTILRFPKRLAAIVLAGVLLTGQVAVYVVFFLPHNGLRDRVITQISLTSSHTIALTTKSVLLGRVATVSLWCTRQVFVLYTRKDDELNLIRGLLEYESPYAMFPRKSNTHTPAINDDDDEEEVAKDQNDGF